MLPIGDDGAEESESDSCRVSSTCGSSSRTMGGGPFLSIVLVMRFETGNGGAESFSMSWILIKGRVPSLHNTLHIKLRHCHDLIRSNYLAHLLTLKRQGALGREIKQIELCRRLRGLVDPVLP